MDELIALPEAWVVPVAAVIPVLVDAVTRWREEKRVHALIALALSGVLTGVATLTDDVGGDTWRSVIGTGMTVFVTQALSYLGFWKPVARLDGRIAPTKGV